MYCNYNTFLYSTIHYCTVYSTVPYSAVLYYKIEEQFLKLCQHAVSSIIEAVAAASAEETSDLAAADGRIYILQYRLYYSTVLYCKLILVNRIEGNHQSSHSIRVARAICTIWWHTWSLSMLSLHPLILDTVSFVAKDASAASLESRAPRSRFPSLEGRSPRVLMPSGSDRRNLPHLCCSSRGSSFCWDFALAKGTNLRTVLCCIVSDI